MHREVEIKMPEKSAVEMKCVKLLRFLFTKSWSVLFQEHILIYCSQSVKQAVIAGKDHIHKISPILMQLIYTLVLFKSFCY